MRPHKCYTRIVNEDAQGEMPLISIVITNYNYGQYLQQAITSALNQTYQPTEIILIDDASTDDSAQVFHQFEHQIKIIEHETNKGIVYSRNEALLIARGEFLCFLDADDFWDGDYLKQMFDVATEFGADVVYPDWRLLGDIDEIRRFTEFDPTLLQLQKIHCHPESLIKLSAVRKFAFESEAVAEDWDYFIRLSLNGVHFKHASNCLINYRIKCNSRSTAGAEIETLRLFVDILKKFQAEYSDRVIDPIELVLTKIDEKNQQIAKVTDRNKQLQDDILAIKNSKSFRLGSALTKPLRIVRDRLRHQPGAP